MRITYKISFKKLTSFVKSIQAEQKFKKETGIKSLPSRELRFHVHGAKDAYTFLEVGRQCANDIISALKKNNREIGSFKNILDFGCGCGRTLVYLYPLATPPSYVVKGGKVNFYGTDIDKEAIDYCKKYLTFAEFDANGTVPPLKYASSSFDLVYAISVFSHLNEEYNHRWMEELSRITKIDGIVQISVNGLVDERGFTFSQSNFWKGIFPDWYGDAHISKKYLREIYANHFKVLDYIPRGVANNQDMVTLQKIA